MKPLGSFSFFRLINILSMDASRQVSLKSLLVSEKKIFEGFYGGHLGHVT